MPQNIATMASKAIPVKQLNDGTSIPMLGYGTGSALVKRDKLDEINASTVSCVSDALSLGFTHLDNAEYYNTEPEMGEAIKQSLIPRSQLFITTKVINKIYDIPNAIDTSLRKLGLEYVDLYLIHNPHFTTEKVELQKAWRDMEAVQRSGKAKSIGVSGCQIKHLESILDIATVIPAVNQVEFHPYLQREALRKFAASKGIATAAFSSLQPIRKGAPGPLDSILEKLAAKYNVQLEAILLRWSIQNGVITITTSRQKQRLEGYLQALTFELTAEEIHDISEVGKEKHFRGSHFMHNYPDTDRE